MQNSDGVFNKFVENLLHVQLNALVWFWLIDETLSANLVYQSD